LQASFGTRQAELMAWLSEAHASAGSERQELRDEVEAAKASADALKAQVALLESELAKAEARAASAEAQLREVNGSRASPESSKISACSEKLDAATSLLAVSVETNAAEYSRTRLLADISNAEATDAEEVSQCIPPKQSPQQVSCETSSPKKSSEKVPAVQESASKDGEIAAVQESTNCVFQEPAALDLSNEVTMVQGIQNLWTSFTAEATSQQHEKLDPFEGNALAAALSKMHSLQLEKDEACEALSESSAEHKKTKHAAEATLVALRIETDAAAHQQAVEYEESLRDLKDKVESLEMDQTKKDIEIVALLSKIESLSAELKTAVEESTHLEVALQHAEERVPQISNEASITRNEYQALVDKMENEKKEASAKIDDLLHKVGSLESYLQAAQDKSRSTSATSIETSATGASSQARQLWLQEHLANALKGYDARRQSLESKLSIALAQSAAQRYGDLSGLQAEHLEVTKKVELLKEHVAEATHTEYARRDGALTSDEPEVESTVFEGPSRGVYCASTSAKKDEMEEEEEEEEEEFLPI